MIADVHIENIIKKQMGLDTSVLPLFLPIVPMKANSWHHFCILTNLNIKIHNGHHLP